jgi:hypothetical protein
MSTIPSCTGRGARCDRHRSGGQPDERGQDHSAGPASDAEREEVVARLHHALGEGRLDLAETEERVAAYAATHGDDLLPLLLDIPTGATTTSEAPPWTAIWALVVWRARSVVWGTDRAGGPPDARQLRLAAVIAALALAWLVACAFLGAAVVGS